MQASRDRALRVAAWCLVPVLAAVCAVPASAASDQENAPTQSAPAVPNEAVFTPAITFAPEVLTPQGAPRMYPVGGGQETIWQPGMPVYVGDRVVLKMFASTGPAALKEIQVRVDNEPMRTLTQAPWVIEIDTANWTPGYHFVEAFAQSSDPEAPAGSGGMVFFVREAPPTQAGAEPTVVTETTVGAVQETITEPETAVAGVRQTPDSELQPPAHPGPEVPMRDGVPLYPAGLDVTIHSRNATVERGIRANEVVRISEPVLFHVAAGRDARRYIYALSRDGREVFRSEALPISAMVRLQPQVGTGGVGLLPGELTMWIWSANAEGVYGAPEMVRVDVIPQS